MSLTAVESKCSPHAISTPKRYAFLERLCGSVLRDELREQMGAHPSRTHMGAHTCAHVCATLHEYHVG